MIKHLEAAFEELDALPSEEVTGSLDLATILREFGDLTQQLEDQTRLVQATQNAAIEKDLVDVGGLTQKTSPQEKSSWWGDLRSLVNKVVHYFFPLSSRAPNEEKKEKTVFEPPSGQKHVNEFFPTSSFGNKEKSNR